MLFYGGNQVERFPLSGLTYDTKARRLFVGDYQNNRVMVFDVATSTITNGETPRMCWARAIMSQVIRVKKE